MFDLDAALKPYIEKSVHRDELSPDALSKMSFVYPYSKEEYAMSRLLSEGVLPFADYEAIKKEYVAKSQNIALFEMAPRAFGEKWGQGHLRSIVPELLAPNKAIDPNYDGDYDLYYQGVRIEVKASRAADQDRTENNPVAKALPYGTGKRFAMNFQQIKCSHCDVFVWIAVWRDRITYWVIKSTDVLNDSHYQPKQHRGNRGEGQFWVTEKNIGQFAECEATPSNLLEKIIECYCADPKKRRMRKGGRGKRAD